jgi:uncharacterized protein (DUF433 family)
MAAAAYRYLVKLPGVRGGNPIVEGTRIGVQDVVGLTVNGATVDDVVRSFPALTRAQVSLTRAQVFESLAYYQDHRSEIDTPVARQMSEPDKNVRFFVDHDVPAEAARVLQREGHEGSELRDALPVTASDLEALRYAARHGLIVVTCNRDDSLALVKDHLNPGLIVLIRRRSRHAEYAALLAFCAKPGESGVIGNVNFAYTRIPTFKHLSERSAASVSKQIRRLPEPGKNPLKDLKQ